MPKAENASVPSIADPSPVRGDSTGKARAVKVTTIARLAGVSPGAVSSLLTSADGRGRVSPRTRALILKTCRDLGYQPKDPRALNLIYPEFGGYCFLLPKSVDNVRTSYYSYLFSGVVEALADRAGQITFCQFDDAVDYHAHPEALPAPLRNGTATKFLCAGQANLSLLEAIQANNARAVYLGQYQPLQGMVSVVPDYVTGTRLMLTHLIGLGHRRIAFSLGPLGANSYNILEQRRTIETVLAEHGIELPPDYGFFGVLGTQGGVTAIDNIMRCAERPTALYCFNDSAAAGAISRAHQLGLRVPEDISITGFDDVPLAASLHPPLTTVHVPIAEIGRTGVRELQAILELDEEDAVKSAPRKVVIPTSLVVRNSTAAPAKA
ncbi:MAG: LacI family DNA-binding transcriptional regulator [Opitutaceae bacterium]|jgi:DNA-binding LacI/PurR family transcriptional regulator